MNDFARNLEILLLNHDLVMIPGLGGFLANYSQAQFDEKENIILPPSRSILFNRDLKANDGLMVHAYMQYFDATYPQAIRQLEVDVQDIKDELNEKGFFIIENIGTIHLDLDGLLTFEQMHDSIVSPSLFALSSFKLNSVAYLENKLDIKNELEQISELPVDANVAGKHNNRKIWKDIAISSAAAVAMFFLFIFPSLNNDGNEKIVAGAFEKKEVDANFNANIDKKNVANDNTPSNNQTQIILLQPQQSAKSAVIISQDDLNNATPINNQNGDYTIVVTYAANEECALYVIDLLNKENLPGAYYHSGQDGNFIYYSSFNTAKDAANTINALKQVNNRFKRAWVKKIK